MSHSLFTSRLLLCGRFSDLAVLLEDIARRALFPRRVTGVTVGLIFCCKDGTFLRKMLAQTKQLLAFSEHFDISD